MAERPDRDEAAEPDRSDSEPDTPSPDAWSDAVDRPQDSPQDGPQDRPRMGFSGGSGFV